MPKLELSDTVLDKIDTIARMFNLKSPHYPETIYDMCDLLLSIRKKMDRIIHKFKTIVDDMFLLFQESGVEENYVRSKVFKELIQFRRELEKGQFLE